MNTTTKQDKAQAETVQRAALKKRADAIEKQRDALVVRYQALGKELTALRTRIANLDDVERVRPLVGRSAIFHARQGTIPVQVVEVRRTRALVIFPDGRDWLVPLDSVLAEDDPTTIIHLGQA